MYKQALQEFNQLPFVNDEHLNGTISELVARVQDELNMQKDFGLVLSKPYYLKLTQFVKKWKGKL